MPIVPYFQNGGQVPLLPSSLPPSAVSTVDLPEYPPAAVFTPSTSTGIPNVAPDAFHEHESTVEISIDYPAEQPQQDSTYSVSGPSNGLDDQMRGRKPAIAAAGTFFGLFTFSQIYQKFLFERITPWSERQDEKEWVASSHYWLDRKACSWFGICGLAHLNQAGWTTKSKEQAKLAEQDKIDLDSFLKDAQALPYGFDEEARHVPQYVLDYAPLIHLYSGENFWPCDMDDHLFHTTPHLNYTPLQSADDHPELKSLNDLNKWGRFVYLKSDDNVEDRPNWLGGETNIPEVPTDGDGDSDTDDSPANDPFDEGKDGMKSPWWHVGIGDTEERGGIREDPDHPNSPVPSDTPEGEERVDKDENWQPELRQVRSRRNVRHLRGKKIVGGRSDAPAVLVVVPKGDGVVDAFWFFFYSYNLGNTVFNVRFGNHVGDWEHTTIRFHNGVPKAVFFSEHSGGAAYTFDAVEKIGKRPVGYSATGTHAMYATPGVHPYVLPGGILHDMTDRGPLWDPAMNMYSYLYDYQTDHLTTTSLNPEAPIGWFYFGGHWGDKFYPLNDPRQYRFVGQYHYVSGPLGPRFKNLGRQEVCQNNGECILKPVIGDRGRRVVKRFPDLGEGEEMSDEDAKQIFGDD